MYRPYRGQRALRRRRILYFILILFALFILAGAVFLLFFQDHSDNGIHVNFPWRKPAVSAQTDKQTPADPASTDTVTQGSADGQENAVVPAEQSPAVTVSPTPKLLEIPADKLGDAAYLAQVQALHEQGAINGAAIVVKDENGALIWKSSFAGVQGTAIESKATDALAQAVQTLQADGLSVTAVLYAYEDNLYAGQNNAAALRNSSTKKTWHMSDGSPWLDPSSETANAYLTALVQELRDMGCNEVVLRGFGWPAEGTGRLSRIAYGDYKDAQARSAKLAETLKTLKAAAGTMEVSVCIDDPAAESGINKGSGQDLGALSSEAARIYVPMVVQTATSGDSIRTIVGRVSGADVSKLVPIYTSSKLAKTLLSGNGAMYFSPSETNGDLSTYLSR